MKTNLKGIKSSGARWAEGIDHDQRSSNLGRALGEINYRLMDDSMCLKFGGDGDNGEELLYALDIYFELLDKERLKLTKNTDTINSEVKHNVATDLSEDQQDREFDFLSQRAYASLRSDWYQDDEES